MEAEIKVTGGAQIGWMNASWPLAKLSVSATSLSISGYVIGSYRFAPDQVVALEPFGKAIRIVHSRPDYPTKIIFWSFRNPERLLDDIRLAGFLPRASAAAAVPTRTGMPVKWTSIILLIVVWNALFLLDGGFVPWTAPRPPGPFVLLAITLLFATSLAVQRSAAVQSWVLKPGRAVGEIQALLVFLQLISGLALVVFTAFALLGS